MASLIFISSLVEWNERVQEKVNEAKLNQAIHFIQLNCKLVVAQKKITVCDLQVKFYRLPQTIFVGEVDPFFCIIGGREKNVQFSEKKKIFLRIKK